MPLFGSNGKKLFSSLRRTKTRTPEGLWEKCPSCGEIRYRAEIERNYRVCPQCNYHFRLSAQKWMELILDEVEKEIGENVYSLDFLNFKDTKSYEERLKKLISSTDLTEAVKSVIGKMDKKRVACCFFDFRFMGGSMGSVVGERLRITFEECARENLPVITFVSSGGARMQEGAVSLMQMAKTINALISYKERCKKPYLTVMGDPTSGGVAASFASLGDVIIAEPRALIGFAGPRVIKETIKQELPEGFQRAEFMLNKGFVDMIVERKNLKETLIKIIDLLE